MGIQGHRMPAIILTDKGANLDGRVFQEFGAKAGVNRRMPKCKTVLQSENDLFEPEIQPNSHGNCKFLTLSRTIKSSKMFWALSS